MIWKKPHSCPVVYVKGKRKYLYRFILIKPFWIKPRCPGGVPMAAVSFTAENKKRTNATSVKKHTFLPQYQHLCHKCKLPFLPPPLLSTDSLAIVFYFHHSVQNYTTKPFVSCNFGLRFTLPGNERLLC